MYCTYLQCVCVGGEGTVPSCMNKIFNIFLKFLFVYADYLSRTLFGGGNGNGGCFSDHLMVDFIYLCVCVFVTSVACTFFYK